MDALIGLEQARKFPQKLAFFISYENYLKEKAMEALLIYFENAHFRWLYFCPLPHP